MQKKVRNKYREDDLKLKALRLCLKAFLFLHAAGYSRGTGSAIAETLLMELYPTYFLYKSIDPLKKKHYSCHGVE